MACLLSATVMRSPDGAIEGYRGIIRDVTALKRHDERLLNVIVNTSHLINTPLTIVFGYLDLVKLDLKKMTPELVETFHEKLSTIRTLVVEDLGGKIQGLAMRTSDGWTPVKSRRRGEE